MVIPYNQLSVDAQTRLTEFSTEFDGALAAQPVDEEWASQYGLFNSSGAIKTIYPLPISAAGYRLREGDDKLRRLFERSTSVLVEEWMDGIEEQAMILEAPDFIGWVGEPRRIAQEGVRLVNRMIAQMLAANPNLELYQDKKLGTDLGIPLFADTHPVNIFNSALGTFDNDHAATAIDSAMLSAAKTRFRARKAPNGESMGLRVTHMIVPGAREEEANDFLQSDNLLLALENKAGTENVAATSTNNRHKGTVQLIVADELTDDDVIYLLDARSNVFPWIVQAQSTPEEIMYDKSSDLYKNTGKVAVKYVLRAGVAAALPHAIERITLA